MTLDFELIALGTGSSAGVPDIRCVTAADQEREACDTCKRCMWKDSLKEVHRLSSRRNTRNNTGAIIRFRDPRSGESRTVLLDVSKGFRFAALEHFPRFGLRRIDAVVLSHCHADAVGGLDELRSWTLHGAIQDTIPIYCSAYTMATIRERTPWLVATPPAKVNGRTQLYIPALSFVEVEEDARLDLFGLELQLFPVHHGMDGAVPLINLGFLIERTALWLADFSVIPPESWQLLDERIALDKTPTARRPALQAAFLDCVGIVTHVDPPYMAHAIFHEVVEVLLRLGRPRTYLVGLPHEQSHEALVRLGEMFERPEFLKRVFSSKKPHTDRLLAPDRRAISVVERFDATFKPEAENFDVFVELARLSIREAAGAPGSRLHELVSSPMPIWIRPACDGMLVTICRGATQTVQDSEYDV